MDCLSHASVISEVLFQSLSFIGSLVHSRFSVTFCTLGFDRLTPFFNPAANKLLLCFITFLFYSIIINNLLVFCVDLSQL
jgi:hypothetical protein